jgi:chromosome partitioning protein
MRVYTLFTHAGGAGKTSLARDLGYELASRGYRVLLVDADPQANLTAWLHRDEEASREKTLLPFVERLEMPKPLEVLPNYDLIPASLELAEADLYLARNPLRGIDFRGALRELPYDFVLVDSLPSLGNIAIFAALASDGLIVPAETTPKGLQAVAGVFRFAGEYARTLTALGQGVGGKFVIGLVPTMYDSRSKLHRESLEALRNFGQVVPVTPPVAYRPAVHARAVAQGLPVAFVDSQEAREEIQGVLSALNLVPEEVPA